MPADPHSAYARAREAAAEAIAEARNDPSRSIANGDLADAALRAYHASLEESGYRVVPVEATTAQLAAAQIAWLADGLRRTSTLYRACISAAPAFPPETEDEG